MEPGCDGDRNSVMAELSESVEELGTAPTYEEMPRRSLEDKGCAGPTAAHVIEEIHTPLNYAYVSFTTGSTAFQNITGVVAHEIPGRVQASIRAFETIGLPRNSRMLVSYPPLVLVFPMDALQVWEITWSFLRRSSRDAFLLALLQEEPDVVIGESTFIKDSLKDAIRLGIADVLPQVSVILAAGTPLDLELPMIAEQMLGARVHDIYGCQEFGWLTLDGVPLRDDISLVPSPVGENYREMVVGGMPMSDSFPVSEAGHALNPKGKIITYRRKRTYPDLEVTVLESRLPDEGLVERVCRTILRTKSRVVKCSPDVKLGQDSTVLRLDPMVQAGWRPEEPIIIEGPIKTEFFDRISDAQVEYERTKTWDPVYTKTR
jgi:hypothetical protein